MDQKELRRRSEILSKQFFKVIKQKSNLFDVIPKCEYGSCFIECYGENFNVRHHNPMEKRTMYALSILLLGEKIPRQGYGDNSLKYIHEELGYSKSFILGLNKSLRNIKKPDGIVDEYNYHLGVSTGIKLRNMIKQEYNG